MVITVPLPPDAFLERVVEYCAAWREPRLPGVRSGGRLHCRVELGADNGFELFTDRTVDQHAGYGNEGRYLRSQFNCRGRVKATASGSEIHAEAVLTPNSMVVTAGTHEPQAHEIASGPAPLVMMPGHATRRTGRHCMFADIVRGTCRIAASSTPRSFL